MALKPSKGTDADLQFFMVVLSCVDRDVCAKWFAARFPALRLKREKNWKVGKQGVSDRPGY